MNTSITTTKGVALPEELVQLFADPPLVGSETREDYNCFFFGIVSVFNPADTIVWIYVKDFVDLSWEIMRDRKIKAHIIKHFETDAVRKSLNPMNWDKLPLLDDFKKVGREARQWATDPEVRLKYDRKLSEAGFTATEILAQAYITGGREIDAIDRRIASYEERRIAVLKTIEYYDEKLARQIEAGSSEVIDGEFTEPAE